MAARQANLELLPPQERWEELFGLGYIKYSLKDLFRIMLVEYGPDNEWVKTHWDVLPFIESPYGS